MLACTLAVLSSVMSPDGTSMLITVACDWLMYFTREANPPVSGRLSPEPNSPSMSSVPESSLGGSKSVVTSVNFFMRLWAVSRLRFSAQSSERRLPMLNSHTATSYPLSSSMRATARASPPLFPGPANTMTFLSEGHSSVMAAVMALAARSIKSTDLTGSCSIVYLSSS